MNTRRNTSVSEVMAWVTTIDTHNLPLTLTLPSDSQRARKSTTSSTSTIRATARTPQPSRVRESLDRAVQGFFGFDSSCLSGLDDQLIASPTAAFTDLCYQSCLEDDRTFIPTSDRNTPVSISHPHPFPEYMHDERASLDGPGSFFSDDSDEDTDECPTRDSHQSVPVTTWLGRSGGLIDTHLARDFSQVNGGNGVIVVDSQRFSNGNQSYIMFESGWGVPQPEEPSSFFHIPDPKPKSSRLAAFVSNFPGKLPRFVGSHLHSHQTPIAARCAPISC